MHPGLPGGRHRRRGQADAHGDQRGMHRLRAARGAWPGSTVSTAAGRRRSRGPAPARRPVPSPPRGRIWRAWRVTEARRKAERATRAAVVPAIPVVQPAAATDDQYKRLKIEAAMAKVVLAKAEKAAGPARHRRAAASGGGAAPSRERAQRALDRSHAAAARRRPLGYRRAQAGPRSSSPCTVPSWTRPYARAPDDAALQGLRANLEAAAQALPCRRGGQRQAGAGLGAYPTSSQWTPGCAN